MKNNKLNSLASIPNINGFNFIAVMKNGEHLISTVIKDENGIHRFVGFSETIGWMHIDCPYNPNQNKLEL
jgi:hypothetical protein